MISAFHHSNEDKDLLELEQALRELIPVQPTIRRDEFFYWVGYAAGQSASSLIQQLLSLIRTAKEFK